MTTTFTDSRFCDRTHMNYVTITVNELESKLPLAFEYISVMRKFMHQFDFDLSVPEHTLYIPRHTYNVLERIDNYTPIQAIEAIHREVIFLSIAANDLSDSDLNDTQVKQIVNDEFARFTHMYLRHCGEHLIGHWDVITDDLLNTAGIKYRKATGTQIGIDYPRAKEIISMFIQAHYGDDAEITDGGDEIELLPDFMEENLRAIDSTNSDSNTIYDLVAKYMRDGIIFNNTFLYGKDLAEELVAPIKNRRDEFKIKYDNYMSIA